MWRHELVKEWRLLSRHWQTSLQVLAFFTLFIFISLLSVQHQETRDLIAPVLWLGVLLAQLLSAENFFEEELRSGVLVYQSLRSTEEIQQWILAKVLVRFVLVIGPLLVSGAIYGFALGLSERTVGYTLLAQLMAAPCLLLLTALGGSFTLLLTRSGLLIALLILPLQIPVIILGMGVTMAAHYMQPIAPLLAFLMAISLLSLTFLPYIIAGSVKLGVP